jgi:hypothetical protein
MPLDLSTILPRFAPARGLEGGHAQTIFAHLARPRHRPPVVRERWDLPDGDVLEVDYLRALEPRAPHVLILHGLEGSSEASYVAAVLRDCAARGWGALAMNHRSCAGENRLARSYHAGETGDPAYAAHRLRERAGGGPVVGIGFSLGANMLLKLLGEAGDAAPLDAGVAVSAPYDLAGSARALDERLGLHTAYRLRFVRSMRAKALAKARRFPGSLDAARAARVRTLREFDDVVTAPLHGYRGVADYYARASAGAAAVREIRRPTLLVSAADDPMVPGAQFPAGAAEANPRVAPLLLPSGGHVGFVAGSLTAPVFWAERAAVRWLAHVVAHR